MKYLIPVLLAMTSYNAAAMTCIPLGGDDNWDRVSDTEIIVTDMYNQKYKVVVNSCPELTMDEPIVVAPLDDELCDSDTLTVGGDICPIQTILSF